MVAGGVGQEWGNRGVLRGVRAPTFLTTLLITGDFEKCDDVNECASNNPCDENAVCSNKIGSFSCLCKVPYWVGNGVRPSRCLPTLKNLCATSTACNRTNEKCVNEREGPKCVCKGNCFLFRGNELQGCVGRVKL